MRILLVCEGKHEGLDAFSEAHALETLVRRLYSGNPESLQFDYWPANDNRLQVRSGGARPRLVKRILRFMAVAESQGCDALVYVIDHDGDDQRLRHIRSAQEDFALTTIHRALGVAVRTFDAWILADNQALSAVLGQGIGTQPSPEGIAKPKQRCAQLLESAGRQMSQSEMYASVVDCARLDELKRRCQRGFAPFARNVERLP